MKTRIFTSGILIHKGNVLILKRASKSKFNPNVWDSVGGHLKEFETAEDNIIREAEEETSLKVKIIKSAKSYEIRDRYGRWIVIPFLLKTNNDKVKINKREHSEYVWIKPKGIKNYKCVPDLKIDLKIFGLV